MPITADRTTEEPRRASTNGVRTTVVLPAYNEGAALPHVLDELGEYLDGSYEVLVVDDGSTDDTTEVAERYPVRLVRHVQRGSGRSRPASPRPRGRTS
jgi:cellulose synthase/poly-beta-1,6-N-acetylglucosamine synthase-like glycosyltransferase